MIVSIRFENEEDGAGNMMVYKRISMTCRAKIGQVDYANLEEKEMIKHIFTTNHPGTEVIGPGIRIGNFVDVYMKR